MFGYGDTAELYDFYAYNAAGQVWNGAAFVNFANGDYVSYRIAATQLGSSGRFQAAAPAGTFSYEMRLRGASLAASYVVWTERGPRETWKVVEDTTAELTIDRT